MSRQEFAIPPQQILPVEAFLTWPVSDSLEDERARRNKAVAAGVQYSGFAEGDPLRGRPKRSAPSKDEDRTIPSPRKRKPEEQPTASGWEENLVTPEGQVKQKPKPKVCFQCQKKYSDYNDVRRHFRSSLLHSTSPSNAPKEASGRSRPAFYLTSSRVCSNPCNWTSTKSLVL